MAVVEVSVAAATAVVGFNLLSNSTYRQSQRSRVIRAVALTGSAAAGDTQIRILVNNHEVATVFNSGTGFPNRDALKRVGARVPAGSEIAALVVDAPATNPINLQLDLEG